MKLNAVDQTSNVTQEPNLKLHPGVILARAPSGKLVSGDSVQLAVEMVLEGALCCAMEGQINVILDPNQKLFLDAALDPVLSGKQGNGASVQSLVGVV